MSTMESAAIQAAGADTTSDTGIQPQSTNQQGNGVEGNGLVGNGAGGGGLAGTKQAAHEAYRSQALADEDLADEDLGPRRRNVTIPQVIGGILIAAIVVAAAIWYVPRIVKADNRSFTGSVSSSGVTNLNFANSGLVGKVPIQLGQAVRAGQVLATETSPSTTAAISADKAAIAADKASLAELKAGTPTSKTQASIAAAGAQLAKDEAQLASDKVKLAETQIIAPEAGTIIAINGQTGETVTAAGIRSYSSQSQTSGSQSPPFSLLPEGPAANVKSSTSQQVSPTPVSTSIGTAYQAIVRISGHQRITPLGGMTANVQLGS